MNKLKWYQNLLRNTIREYNAVAREYWTRPLPGDNADYTDNIDNLPDPDMSADALMCWAIVRACEQLDQQKAAMQELLDASEDEKHVLKTARKHVQNNNIRRI